MPKGIGIYIRALSTEKYGTPAQAAAKAKARGVSFVVILAVWQEGNTRVVNAPGTRAYEQYVEAFTAAGIDVYLWGYPWAGREDGFILRMRRAIQAVPGMIRGIVLDPERGYKWFQAGQENKARDGATRLVLRTIDLLNENMTLGVTSFGQPNIHKNFPWREFAAGFGSPQFYTVGEHAIDAGTAQWRQLGFTSLLPSVPAFGPNSEDNLDEYLQCFPLAAVDGFIVWSWPQIGAHEWTVLERWADIFATRDAKNS